MHGRPIRVTIWTDGRARELPVGFAPTALSGIIATAGRPTLRTWSTRSATRYVRGSHPVTQHEPDTDQAIVIPAGSFALLPDRDSAPTALRAMIETAEIVA